MRQNLSSARAESQQIDAIPTRVLQSSLSSVDSGDLVKSCGWGCACWKKERGVVYHWSWV